MEKQLFGEVYLPKIFEEPGYPYSIIARTKNKFLDTDKTIYWLIFSDNPFYCGQFVDDNTGLTNTGISFNSASNVKGYQALSEGNNWGRLELIYNKDAPHTKICDYEDYIWTSYSISDWQTGEQQFNTYQPTLITNAADSPTITLIPKSAEYEIYDYVDSFLCLASTEDRGTITYEWYEQGVGLVGTGQSFTPLSYVRQEIDGKIIATTGIKTYYCIITNSNNNTKTCSMVNNITLTILPSSRSVEDNFSLYLGWLSGVYAKRQSIVDLKKPLVNLDFSSYYKNTPIIRNSGTSGSVQNATVNLGEGEVYYEDDGLVLTKNSSFTIPVNITCDFTSLKLGTVFTWMITVSDFSIRDAMFNRICLSEDDLLTVFYYSYAQKFCAKLSSLPQSDKIEFEYNSSIVTYEEDKGYIFDIKPGDTITFVCDSNVVKLYINENFAMKMSFLYVAIDDDLFLKKINTIGCGDITGESNYYFEKLKIGKFLFYDKALNSSQIKAIISKKV